MGHHRDAERMFTGIKCGQKTVGEVRTKMKAKLEAVAKKIVERQARVALIMREYDITDATLADMVIRYTRDQERGQLNVSYSTTGHKSDGPSREEKLVPAGVVANIVTEKRLIDSEQGEVDRMEFLLRNMQSTERALNPTTGEVIAREVFCHLDDNELTYLGF